MTRKPRIWYIVKFHRAYRCRTYFDADEKDRAKAFVKHVYEQYQIRGKVIKVQECK